MNNYLDISEILYNSPNLVNILNFDGIGDDAYKQAKARKYHNTASFEQICIVLSNYMEKKCIGNNPTLLKNNDDVYSWLQESMRDKISFLISKYDEILENKTKDLFISKELKSIKITISKDKKYKYSEKEIEESIIHARNVAINAKEAIENDETINQELQSIIIKELERIIKEPQAGSDILCNSIKESDVSSNIKEQIDGVIETVNSIKKQFVVLGEYFNHDYPKEIDEIVIYMDSINEKARNLDAFPYKAIMCVFTHELFHAYHYHNCEQSQRKKWNEDKYDVLIEGLASYIEYKYSYFNCSEYACDLIKQWDRNSILSWPYSSAKIIKMMDEITNPGRLSPHDCNYGESDTAALLFAESLKDINKACTVLALLCENYDEKVKIRKCEIDKAIIDSINDIFSKQEEKCRDEYICDEFVELE